MGRDSRFNQGQMGLVGGNGAEIASVRDVMGRRLQEGDLVTPTDGTLKMFHVQAITPAVQPDLPAGAMFVDIICSVRLVVTKNQPIQELLQVQSIRDREDARRMPAQPAPGVEASQ